MENHKNHCRIILPFTYALILSEVSDILLEVFAEALSEVSETLLEVFAEVSLGPDSDALLEFWLVGSAAFLEVF